MNTNITYNFDVKNIYNFDNNDYTIKNYTYNNVDYKIIKYNKERLQHYKKNDINKFIELGKFRSVILKNDKLLVFSPPKSIDINVFKDKYTDINKCWTEDFIDGTMINLFFDTTNNSWEISTKSLVGGNSYFYDNNNHTFRSMFFEACNANNFNINSLPQLYKYTFVMQHPNNRIVTPIDLPKLFLVKIYEITETTNNIYKITEINTTNFANTPPYIFLNTGVIVLYKYFITSYDDINNHYNSNVPYYCVGSMIFNEDGTRSKIRNNNYEYVRKLRGNQPKLQYNYLCLKKENKVKEYLQYYPEHKFEFNNFKNQMYNYTNDLFLNYISCFIRKEKMLKDYEFQFKTHMYKIHEEYKNKLVSQNKKIDKKFVIDYINNLHPAQQMFVINYSNYNNKPDETVMLE